MTSPTDIEKLVACRRALVTHRDAVTTWMTEQGKLGNLVYASQAPSWPAYEAAHVEWNKVEPGVLDAFDKLLADRRELVAALSEALEFIGGRSAEMPWDDIRRLDAILEKHKEQP